MRPLPAAAVWIASAAAAFAQTAGLPTIEQYRQLVISHPDSSMAHYQIGLLLQESHNLRTAAMEFDFALKGDLQPKWVEVWSHLHRAEIFEATGEHQRAIKEAALALQTGDDTAGARAKANLYLGEGRLGSAHVELTGPTPASPVQPEYTAEARLAGLEGSVVITGHVNSDGSARDLHISEGLGLGLDEAALEVAKHWQFLADARPGETVSAAIDFLLPEKQSRWHLVGVMFQTPAGVSRPAFAKVKYPLGAGISRDTVDEARIVAATGRLGTARLRFEVDVHGDPVHFQIQRTSESSWANEAIALVSEWKFTPGMKDGVPVAVPCIVDVGWGARTLSASTVAQLRSGMDYQAAPALPAPTATYSPQPTYPENVRATGVEGVVSIVLTVDEAGKPGHLHIIRSLQSQLDIVAIQTVATWRFRPTLINGAPTPVPATVEVQFKLR